MEEDIDLDKKLVKSSYCGDDECSWLSSAVSSPSSVFEDYRFSTSLHVSIDEKLFISWLSRLENFVLYLDKGSLHFEDPRVNANPEEKAEDILNNSTSPDAASDSSMNKSESFRSSSGQFCEDSTSCNNSLMPCSTNFDSSSYSSSQMSDSDRISFLVSLVNLDGEDSQWISSDAELDSDYFPSGFPSPSCKNCEVSLWENNSLDQEVNLEDFDTDEPLFWPSQWKLDWNCEENWRCFSMSPRKYITDPGTLQHTSSNVVGTKFHVRRKDTNEGFRESPEFSSGSTASTLLERKQRSKNNFIRKINPAPSRLRKPRKISMKIVPIEMENDLDQRNDKEVPIQQSNCSDRDFLEDDFTKNGEVPIEKLLGLGEFNGHEGVDSEFNEDIFSLEESP